MVSVKCAWESHAVNYCLKEVLLNWWAVVNYTNCHALPVGSGLARIERLVGLIGGVGGSFCDYSHYILH